MPSQMPQHYPHSTEDTVVEEEYEPEHKMDSTSLYDRLSGIAEWNSEDIFPQLKERKFVDEKTVCPSVGILKCREKDLRVEPNSWNNSKQRLNICLPGQGYYNFDLTGLEYVPYVMW